MVAQRRSRGRQGMLSSFRKTLAADRASGRRSPWPPWRWPTSVMVMTVVLGLVIGFVMWRITHPDMVDRATPMTAYADLPPNAATDTAWDPRWPALPIRGFPARRLEHIREAYAFAARRPDVMQYIPCYCGCGRLGHRSNEECYVRRRTDDGIPTWNSHGVTCGICVDVTRDVAGMIAERKPDEIRRFLDAKYFTAFGRSTTTPNPPASSLR